MKYENMKEVSHGFCKKYNILQNLVCVMITVNISSNLRCLVRSAITNEFKIKGSRRRWRPVYISMRRALHGPDFSGILNYLREKEDGVQF